MPIFKHKFSGSAMDYQTIKTWAVEDRPREKMLEKGRQTLTEAELLAILIGSGTRGETALELSKRILANSSNDLSKLCQLSIQDLTEFNGIGEAKAIAIVAALELGRRRQAFTIPERFTVNSSASAFQAIFSLFLDLEYEEFRALFLSRSGGLIIQELISRGGVSGTYVDPKIIFKLALRHSASSIILCHNHPSGNLQPSTADIELTKKLKQAGTCLDIPIKDHLVISNTTYFSFADQGIL
jgi:DNA repair protein RadC